MRMDIPRIGAGAPGAQDRASHLQGEQPGVSRPLAPNPRFHPTVSRQVLRPLQLPGIPSPKPPSASGFPAFSGCTFCELKDWVQWYRTRLSLGQWAGLAAWGASGASAGLAASLSSAEMGHQLQLVGVRLLGVAMTARNQRKKRRRLRQRRLSLAQHHMASPSLPLSFSPSLPSP